MTRRRRSGRRWLVGLGLVACLVWPLAHAGTGLIVEQSLVEPDAIIMLASHEWERLPATAALARRHPNATVLITLPAPVTADNCHRCGERSEWLEAEGVEHTRIRVLRGVRNTLGEALAALAYSRHTAFERLTIVTSPYHTRRALATFERVFRSTGVSIGVLPASPARGHPGRWWADSYDRRYVRYEWAALVSYWFQHDVPLIR